MAEDIRLNVPAAVAQIIAATYGNMLVGLDTAAEKEEAIVAYAGRLTRTIVAALTEPPSQK